MNTEFSQSVIESLKYYVYALVDPRDNRIFYIGKGKGNRIFQHAENACKDDESNLKLDTIRNIIQGGKKVEYYILRHNLTEEEAYIVESTLIDLLTYPKFNKEFQLANISAGHHQWDEGIKSVEDVNALYCRAKIKPKEGEKLLLVNLNQSFDKAKSKGVYQRLNIYEATRKYWVIGKNQPQQIKYILGVYKKIVRSVIKVESYTWVESAEEDGTIFPKPRCCFEGQLCKDSPYLNKDISDYPFGSGAAIRYIEN